MRDVYFDPFGSYTQGYDKGTERQVQVEQNTRLARDSDYKYNVLNPYELNEIRRNDAFGADTQGARTQMFKDIAGLKGNEYFNSNMGVNNDFARISGVTNPIVDQYLPRYGYSTGPAPAGAAPMMQQPPTMQQPAQQYLPQAPQPQNLALHNATQQPVDAGAVFWNAVQKLGRQPTAQEGQAIASYLSTQFGVPMPQLEQQIVAARNPAPQAAIAAQAPVSQQYNLPQQPQMPQGQPTYIYDQQGNVVQAVPDFARNILDNINYDRGTAQQTFLQNQANTIDAAMREQQELAVKAQYNKILQNQIDANSGGSNAGGMLYDLIGGP